MKQHIKSLPHHPKRVILISLVLAAIIGVFSYIEINKKPITPTLNTENSNEQTTSSGTNKITLGFLATGRIKSVSVKPGDVVKKDEVLATLDAGNVSGALEQARASYVTAQANYQKVINGATGSTIDVAKASVNAAKINLDQITNEENTLVSNARRKLYSDDLVADPDIGAPNNNPLVSGNYNGTEEGNYFISFKDVNFININYVGLEKGTADVDKLPQPLGALGLRIAFPLDKTSYSYSNGWVIHIPNKSGVDYTNNLNAYDLALQTKSQAIAAAQATLDQANANLTAVITSARPEDVATAKAQMDNAAGTVQIAEAAYKNTIIAAPSDGIIISVAIAPGQIALPNAPAIEFISTASTETSPN
ncbi:MAG: HlyD family secretion protein [Minisyncoccia bacterium]